MIGWYSGTRGEPILRNRAADRRSRRRRTSGAFATAFALTSVWSETVSARGLSFAEARHAAERHAPDVQLAALRLAGARADVDTAGALPNPTLGLSTATRTAKLGTSLSLPLPVFGQRGTAVSAARADARTVGLDVRVAQRDARWGATLAWLDLWEAEQRARLLALGAGDAQRLLQIATEKYGAGSGSRVDVVRAGAGRATAAAEADAASKDAAAAGARLSPWIGGDPRDSLEASGEPGYPDALVANGALDERRASHPVLLRDQSAAAAADAHVRNQERQRWPLLVPQVALNQFDPTLSGPDLIVGVAIEVPLLYQRGGEIGRARAEQAIARKQLEWDSLRLGSDLVDASRRAEGADAKLRALKEQVLPAVQEAASLTEEGYSDGRMDLVRVLEAQRALLDARTSEVGAVAARARAIADMERSAGLDLTGVPGAR